MTPREIGPPPRPVPPSAPPLANALALGVLNGAGLAAGATVAGTGVYLMLGGPAERAQVASALGLPGHLTGDAGWALAGAGAFLVAFFGFFLATAVLSDLSKRRLLATGEAARGRVTAAAWKRRGGGGRPLGILTVEYEFTTAAGPGRGSDVLDWGRLAAVGFTPGRGDEVVVVYDPDRPGRTAAHGFVATAPRPPPPSIFGPPPRLT